ncbi:MAG: hypothetical protein KF788_08550 [Piscinibacter sp.]|nr:hypothetical protein [Piscinibacter sp.]
MGRETRSAEQLRAMVQVRLNALPAVAALAAQRPDAGPIAGPVLPAEDAQGRTWDIRDLYQGIGYQDDFRAIVDDLRERYDLAA